jgi:hypothetical protein
MLGLPSWGALRSGAYGDKVLGAGQAFVSNSYSKYFSSSAMRQGGLQHQSPLITQLQQLQQLEQQLRGG